MPTPQNNSQLAYQVFSAYWNSEVAAANVVELQAGMLGVGSGLGSYRDVDSPDWNLMSDSLNILARAAAPSNPPDPYRTLIGRFTSALNAYRAAIAPVFHALDANPPDFVAAIKAAAASDTAYPPLEQAIEAMRQRQQGGPIAIVP